MPIYLYECKKCGHKCETLKDRCSSADDTQGCVNCGGTMVRIISGVGATFKGKGFYCNDYKN